MIELTVLPRSRAAGERRRSAAQSLGQSSGNISISTPCLTLNTRKLRNREVFAPGIVA